MNNNEENTNLIKDNNKPMIITLSNLPLYFINDREEKIVENLVNSRDEKLLNVQGIVLCRCGASKNKPFCDGNHSTINFKDDKTNSNLWFLTQVNEHWKFNDDGLMGIRDMSINCLCY